MADNAVSGFCLTSGLVYCGITSPGLSDGPRHYLGLADSYCRSVYRYTSICVVVIYDEINNVNIFFY